LRQKWRLELGWIILWRDSMVKWIKDANGDFLRTDSIERIYVSEDVSAGLPVTKYFSVCVEMKYHPSWNSTVELMRFEMERDARLWMESVVRQLNTD